MNGKSELSENKENSPAYDHAVVIGSGIAGLTAARVLADHFGRVTLIERDHVPDTPEFRRGVPQARHAHTLKPRGQLILEQLFPGLADDLVDNGAIAVDPAHEIAYFSAGKWHKPYYRVAVKSTASSRPLLEDGIYRRLAARSSVNVIQDHEVAGLSVTENGQRVDGVRLHNRHEPNPTDFELEADLVVDASGRGSQAPQWLDSLGYRPPTDTTVDAFSGYATRIYRRPSGFFGRWKSMYILPTPPHGTRGGVVVPLEDDRWHVTLMGMARDYPPTDEEGFLAFARSLPSQALYETIKDSEPLTKPYGFRGAVNRMRHYENLSQYLEGLLVFGDAVYTLNPVYAQGMTVAAMGSLALDRSLKAQRRRHDTGDVTGLAQSFQKQLSKVVAGMWKIATEQDRRWPAAESVEAVLPIG